MRIFRKEHRIHLSTKNESEMFMNEYDYYTKENQYPVILFKKNIINIYKNINIQVLLTNKCNYNCPFCIEKDNKNNDLNRNYIPDILDQVLEQYYNQGINPHVSITGGEPTLFPELLLKTLKVTSKYKSKTNVNSNGSNIDILNKLKCIINISRHHYIDSYIKESFNRNKIQEIPVLDNITLQCTLTKSLISNIEEIKQYLEFYMKKGFKSFSFRGLSTLDNKKDYGNVFTFINKNKIDFLKLCDEVAQDEDFKFIQQKIGDHYIFEFYKYKNSFIRFTYSNFDFLRKLEFKERLKSKWFSRATIIHPSGIIYSGWTYDLNKIWNIKKI